MLIEIWKSIKGLWQMKYLYTWTRARWSIYMLVTFLYKSKNKKIFVSLLKAQTYCNSLGFFKNKNIFFWTQTLWLEMSPTSNSLEKVLVVWSSMTCFTNCFTVSGSWPSGTQDWILTTSWSPQPNSYNKTTRGSFEHVTCGQQQGCRWSRYNFRRCVIWVEISCLETVSVTYTQT